VQAAHTVYCSVFFASMVLCLLAIVPALFLWGKKQPLAAPSSVKNWDAIETLHEAEIVAALPSATNVAGAEASGLRKRKTPPCFYRATIA